MSCTHKACSSITVARPLASIELDWPWPDWFADLSPGVSRLWHKRRERQRLAELDDHLLADIGVSREQAEQESRKWFWE